MAIFELDLLPFKLPEFSRTSWVSDNARAVWEPRFRRIARAWQEIEWQSVALGYRPCALVMASPASLIEKAGVYARCGLSMLPVERIRKSHGDYSNEAVSPIAGQPFDYRIAVGSIASVAELDHAWNSRDNRAIGALLGFPQCCFEFFDEVWAVQGLRDTSWPMAFTTSASPRSDVVTVDDEDPYTNIFWRYHGLRMVPHLPCRFDCQESQRLGEALLGLGIKAGYMEEMEWLQDVLRWPVEWSSLHGIALINTPVMRVSASTDATATKRTIRWVGSRSPAEGALGQRFPYLSKSKVSPPSRAVLSPSRSPRKASNEISAQKEMIWSKLAEPQGDGYDTSVLLEIMSQLQSLPPIQGGAGERKIMGTVDVEYRYTRLPKGTSNASLTSTTLVEAEANLRAWPAAARQFAILMKSFHPVLSPSFGSGEGAFLNGCQCHSDEDMPRTMWATVNCPFMLAEAFVHEMAHQKLFALGVKKEHASRLITNRSDALFKSPIIKDRRRPMTAVIHAAYAYAHVTHLNIEILRLPTTARRMTKIQDRLRVNLGRLEEGLREIQDHVEADQEGTLFLGGLFAWIQELQDRGARELNGDRRAAVDSRRERELTEKAGAGQRVFRRDPQTRMHSSWDEARLSKAGGKVQFELNSSARMIWELCDGVYKESEIAEILADRFGFEGEELLSEVTAAIETMSDAGVLVLVQGAAE